MIEITYEFAPEATCDNCGNDNCVQLDTERMEFLCDPCRDALSRGDEGTYNLRRMVLKGDP